MNHKDAAEKILLTLRNHTAYTIAMGKIGEATLEEELALRVNLIAAKLTELYGEVPESLGAAVRDCCCAIYNESNCFRSELEGLTFLSTHERITTAVAPLLVKRERVIADQKKRIEELEETCNCLYREAIEQWREDVKTGRYTVKPGDTKRRPFLMAVGGILGLKPEPEPESPDEA